VEVRVPQSNMAKTISDPQTLILIPFPFPVSLAGSEQNRTEQSRAEQSRRSKSKWKP